MIDKSAPQDEMKPLAAARMRRRDFLRSASSLVTVAAVGTPILDRLLGDEAVAAESAPPPHIVHIISDDQGWKDVGFHGSDIKTPNIDKLARTGAELQQFYTQPFCSQTRAAMLTGRYPFRYGMQIGAIPSGGHYGVPTDERYLSESLREAGYTTALVGKWHVGHFKKEFWPRHRGFDYFYGALVGEIDYFTHEAHGVVDWYRGDRQVKEKGYATTLLGNDAVKLIEGYDGKKPLYLYLAFTSPHTPYQAPQEYLDQYKHISDPSRRAYAAMITAMDDQIGRVVAALEKRKMRDNTLILFHSDNGGTRSAKFTGESVVKGELPPNNGPYRDGKGTLYEGGTRVVALANWPNKIKAGQVNEMIHIVDLFPTLIGLAKAKPGTTKPLDGMDVWQTIAAGQKSPRSEIVYNIDPSGGAVRQGDTKLVWLTLLPNASVELFDLAADPSEKNNLAEKDPDKVNVLQKRIRELSKEMAMPFFLTDALRSTLSAPPSTPSDVFTISD